MSTLAAAASERIQSDGKPLPASSIPVFTTLAQLREWRNKAFSENKSVGFIPTLGALHEGHSSLVRRSLAETDLTIVSIFVNPTQFALHEDLDSYPRTLPQDLDVLASLCSSNERSGTASSSSPPSTASSSALAVFYPSVTTMYPSASPSSPSSFHQIGTFVEVKDLQHQLEGASRPTFFRGITTIVTKLFNVIQPSHAYFGQKDIQQGVIMRRMCSDLLLMYPTSERVHIVPTTRGEQGLALSSRNVYLSEKERVYAPALYRALGEGEKRWHEGATKDDVVRAAVSLLEEEAEKAREDGVRFDLVYIEMNDSRTLQVVDGQVSRVSSTDEDVLILSGALWVGKTRLIDNILLGDISRVIY